ncbi:MAG: endolytic transglycosylase MltG [bacterium]|nr:endolytic transglycosylase MltG [bacterium]
MASFEKFLERAFDAYDRVLNDLSNRWREHANRRTIITLLSVGTLAIVLYLNVIRPPDNFPLDTLVTIEDGATVSDAASVLESNHVVRSGTALRYLIILLGDQKNVHAGDYLFKEPRDLFSVARAIVIGAYGLEPLRIRIPEGATTKEMARILEARLLRFNGDTFIAEAQPLEGFLFPDTYYFLPNASEELVIRTMRQTFDTRTSEIDAQIKSFGKPLNDVIIMASLLEREARTSKDRRMIAGVLWNRLNKGMLLQVDAAFRYTIGKGTYQLTTEDLASDSPYNTYRNPGLPPTPIGSPSLDSILAAVTPLKHNYLYYLADRSGVTHYSKTYAEHLRYKRKYID